MGMAGKALTWTFRDYLDLTIIATTHGLSDGFSSLLVPVLALIVTDLDLSTFEAGLLLSVRSVATFLFLYPLSILADSSGRKKEILIVGLSLAAGAYLAMGAAKSLYPLAVLAFLAGAGNARGSGVRARGHRRLPDLPSAEVRRRPAGAAARRPEL